MSETSLAMMLLAIIMLAGASFFLFLLWKRNWTWIGLFVSVGCLLASVAHFQILVQMITLSDYTKNPSNIGLIVWYHGLGWGLLLLIVSLLMLGAMIAALMPVRKWSAAVICLAGFYFLTTTGTWMVEQWTSTAKLPGFSIGAVWPTWIAFPAFVALILGPFLCAIPWSLMRQVENSDALTSRVMSRFWAMFGTSAIMLSILSVTMIIGIAGDAALSDDPASRAKLTYVVAVGLVLAAVLYIMLRFRQTFLLPAISLLERIESGTFGTATIAKNAIWGPLARSLEKANQEAERSRQIVTGLFAHAPLQVYVTDLDHRIEMVNDWVYRETGAAAFHPSNVIGLSADQMVPSAWAQMSHGNDPVVVGHGEETRVEVRGEFGGKERDIISIRFPIRDEAGRINRIGGFVLDNSAEKRAEAALGEQLAQLHQSEKLAALGSMLAGVSHELNNPLAAVIGQADLLAEDLEGTEHADRVSKIRRAADRCARIVQSFLAMARQKPPEYRTIQINDQVRAAVELTEYQMRAANVTVDLCLGEPLPAIAADPDQLHQVFANLLTNARQALEDCGEDRRITITTSRKGKTIKLTVADNGRGIDAATRERIFDPFFTTKDVGSGTGIGLSFSLGIIEAHGGTLTVEAAKIGTVFAITLPAESQNAEDSAPEAMASPQAKGRVLVIDDEQDVADTLKDLLTRLGLHTEVAIGGRAGQAALASGATFDLILSDIRMPDLDGPGLYAWMVETRPDLLGQVAFVTGDTMSSRVAAFLDEVNCPILEKPFTARSLSDLVAGVLGK